MEGGGKWLLCARQVLGILPVATAGDQPASGSKSSLEMLGAFSRRGTPTGLGVSWGLCCCCSQLLVQEPRGRLWGG